MEASYRHDPDQYFNLCPIETLKKRPPRAWGRGGGFVFHLTIVGVAYGGLMSYAAFVNVNSHKSIPLFSPCHKYIILKAVPSVLQFGLWHVSVISYSLTPWWLIGNSHVALLALEVCTQILALCWCPQCYPIDLCYVSSSPCVQPQIDWVRRLWQESTSSDPLT